MGNVLELLEGMPVILEGLAKHPLYTLGAAAVIGAGIYGGFKWDDWATPSRTQDIFQRALEEPVEFSHSARIHGTHRSTSGNVKISADESSNTLFIEYGRKSTGSFLRRTYESFLIVDNFPFGSVDG